MHIYLLNAGFETFPVVFPVEDLLQGELFVRAVELEPFREEVLSGGHVRKEDCDGDGSLGNASSVRLIRNDVSALQTLTLDNLVSEELSKAFRSCNLCSLQ